MAVRCLPNPFYIPELKHLTGLDKDVRDYVLESEETTEFLKRLEYARFFRTALSQRGQKRACCRHRLYGRQAQKCYNRNAAERPFS